MKTRSRVEKSKTIDARLPTDLVQQLTERLRLISPSVKTDYLTSEILSKFVSDETDPASVRRERAIFKWLCTEQNNAGTIERLINTNPEFNLLPRVTFERFVSFCQDIIADIIGDTPPVDSLIGSFSGGASTSRPRTESHPAFKYVGRADVTADALPVFASILDEMPGWIGFQEEDRVIPNLVRGNVLFTVPKKTDIDRVACKEPDINMFLQKGVGNFFRKSLRRIGINLNDQSINRRLAREGSITGNLATLDLSSASDSVTTELVFQMLPIAWYTLLDSLRSKVTIIDGEEHVNQMFSSMGNGFTFELESLLFYSITRAVAYFTGTPGVVSVYGDDIICPSSITEHVSWALEWFGFQVNPDKSHSTGHFRESCGGHYYMGIDITPFYIRGPISSLPDLIDVANKLRQWAIIDPSIMILDPEVEEIWLWLKAMVPSCLWGGYDTSFKFQLVSNDIGSHRLQSETKRSNTGSGGYYQWLNATSGRTVPSDGVSTSSRLTDTGRTRLRPVRNQTVTQLSYYFYHEVA